MLTTSTSLFFIILLLIAVLLEPLAEKKRIPFSIILVITGFIGSEIAVGIFNIDTGIRWDNFKNIIFYIILPILIFQAAIGINVKILFKNIIPILVMALPLMVISVLITAAGLYAGIDHPSGFPWIAAFITGALLSATDPAAVITLLKRANTQERLRVLLEGESLFNDATAIVLFTILIAVATNEQESATWSVLLLRFFEVFSGGIFTGIAVGIIASLAVKCLDNQSSFVFISILSAYSAFILSEDILHFSGVIAVLSCGMMIGFLCSSKLKEDSFANQSWQLLAKIAESMIFLLAGITITLGMFIDQWLAILIGITAVVFARIAIILGVFPFLSLIPGIEPVPLKQQTILVWGGVRGTVTLALALSLPLALDYWYTIQSIAYGVVIFTLFFQTMTLPILLKKL